MQVELKEKYFCENTTMGFIILKRKIVRTFIKKKMAFYLAKPLKFGAVERESLFCQ